MNKFIPLQFSTFNWQKLQPQDIITPPYDVYDQNYRQQLAQKHPYNFVHLDVPESYDTANRLIQQWFKDHIITKLAQPAYFLMKTDYTLNQQQYTRWGLFGGLKLAPLGTYIFPHEKTYPKAKQDRLNLMQATSSQLSPIFVIYQDNTCFLTSLGEHIQNQPPFLFYEEQPDLKHYLWTIPKTYHQEITLFFQDKKFFIADGHHRYDTALTYKNLQNQPGPWDYVFTYLSNMSSPGSQILPYHRMLTWEERFDFKQVLEKAQTCFKITSLQPELLPQENEFDFILLLPNKAYGFLFTGERDCDLMHLSTYLLDKFMLQNYLNLSEDKLKTGKYIKYTPFEKEIKAKLNNKAIQAAFLVKSVSSDLFQKICMDNTLMPRKSTYFYPKVPSGLLFYSWI
ncbi:MAG: DUF1015 domain-containing protein [Desulfonauticus sp.]|nr:DUF1015 domain-containing protein [Desulfonauticus sp.]